MIVVQQLNSIEHWEILHNFGNFLFPLENMRNIEHHDIRSIVKYSFEHLDEKLHRKYSWQELGEI